MYYIEKSKENEMGLGKVYRTFPTVDCAKSALESLAKSKGTIVDYEPTDYEKDWGHPLGGTPCTWQYVVRANGYEYRIFAQG